MVQESLHRINSLPACPTASDHNTATAVARWMAVLQRSMRSRAVEFLSELLQAGRISARSDSGFAGSRYSAVLEEFLSRFKALLEASIDLLILRQIREMPIGFAQSRPLRIGVGALT